MMKGSARSGGDDEETTIDADKLSYEIFSILESRFLFGYDDDPAKPHASPSSAAAALKSQRGKVRILSIDGAGMRAILQGKALAHLERSLRTISGDPQAAISDYFDLAAGTGLGGIFAAMLFAAGPDGRPRFSADDTWRFLANNAHRFYKGSPSSSSSSSSSPSPRGCCFWSPRDTATAAVERAVKEAFGADATLRDTVKPLLIPCYDVLTASPFVFSRADALESPSFDFRLWEVCRATSAEPGRFDPAAVRSLDGATGCLAVDGGLAMSNPAAAAITHVLHNKQEFPFVRGVEDVMVLSLGCGGRAEASASSAAAAAAGAELRRLRRWGAREWARPAARIAADSASDLVDHAVAMAFGQRRSSSYVRIQANGSTMGNLGANADSDPSPKTIKLLMGAADEMLKQKNVESVLFGGKRMGEQTNMEKLDWFAGELVLEHQRRSCRIAPTVAIKQAPRKQEPLNANS